VLDEGYNFVQNLTSIRGLHMMIRRAKGLELMKIIFITHLKTFASKVFWTLKIMNFENVPLTKFGHTYVIEGMNV
jgi:hypothetical protein